MGGLLLSGGSGLLGRRLLALSPSAAAPAHSEMDVTRYEQVVAAIEMYRPAIVVHCAAIVGSRECSEDLRRCLEINVAGTGNVVAACARSQVRLVYISTDYVFAGSRGQYTEDDPVGPLNEYGKSKAAGELVVGCYSNSVAIRTAFCSSEEWKFEYAFADQFTSRDTVDVIAPQVLVAAASDLTGLLHLGTDRKSQYDLARSIDPRVKPITLDSVDLPLPRDTSLDCTRWNTYKSSRGL